MKNNTLTKEQELEFNRGLFHMSILKGEQPQASIAEYFYRLGLNSQYKNNE